MEIRFYTRDMDFIGLMENQSSFTWTRKYFEPGKIRLFCPITQENLRLTERGNLIYMRGCNECAVVEDRTVEQNVYRNQIEVNGRFISSYLDRRLIRPTFSFSGKTEVAMRRLITDLAVAIPRLVLGDLQGFPETVTFQATYKNLLEYMSKLSRSSGIGFRVRPDFNAKQLVFETYKGVDRSFGQYVNPRVIFSEDYDNLQSMTYRENEQFMKNVVYIGGTGQSDERIYVSYGDATGLDRRELFVDARDLIQDEEETLANYQARLLQRGHERQEQYYQLSTTVESEADPDGNFVYKRNYDLGDIVTVRKRAWGIQTDLRITEIQEIYERGTMKVSPTFGVPLPETIKWEDD